MKADIERRQPTGGLADEPPGAPDRDGSHCQHGPCQFSITDPLNHPYLDHPYHVVAPFFRLRDDHLTKQGTCHGDLLGNQSFFNFLLIQIERIRTWRTVRIIANRWASETQSALNQRKGRRAGR
jgi:hypothetical protein